MNVAKCDINFIDIILSSVCNSQEDNMSFKEKYKDIRNSASFFSGDSKAPLLAVRLTSLVIMVALLTIHLRSLRVFRWEHSVTGGIIVAYFVATLGLTLCAGTDRCGGAAFQAYLSGTGAALMAVNAAAIWRRWKRAGDLTRVVAELLAALGVQLTRQVRIKVLLSVAAAILMLIDLIFTPILMPNRPPHESKNHGTYNAVIESKLGDDI